jgi:hypothetical protein
MQNEANRMVTDCEFVSKNKIFVSLMESMRRVDEKMVCAWMVLGRSIAMVAGGQLMELR